MIIIDSDNYEAMGIETMFFPGGEPHVKFSKEYKKDQEVVFFGKLRNWLDVGIATLVIDTLTRQWLATDMELKVFIPYFPGARQDKQEDLKYPFTVDVMARLLYHRDLAHFAVFDIHSQTGLHMLRRQGFVRNYMPSELHYDFNGKDVVGVIGPDIGAWGRAHQFASDYFPHLTKKQVLTGEKVRDAESGRITMYGLPPLPTVGHYFVVDDICDGGATFNMLAQSLLRDPNGARSKFSLYVSHGIFSKGLGNIHPMYSHIYTTDSWCRIKSGDRLTVIPLLPLLTKEEE